MWRNLTNTIKPVNYGIANSFITTLNSLQEATELPELFMKSNEEKAVWKMLRRVSDQIQLELDHRDVDQATHIMEYRFNGLNVSMDQVNRNIVFDGMNKKEIISFEHLSKNPSSIFRLLVEMLELRG